MLMLTISGLKQALNFIQSNSKNIKYNERGSRQGMIMVPEGLSEDEQYHLRLVQKMEPKLINPLSEGLTVLSLAGQELLDILSDDAYIVLLTDKLKSLGYTAPSDRQIFRLLQERMNVLPIADANPAMSLHEVFGAFFDAAMNAQTKSKPVLEQAKEQPVEIAPIIDPLPQSQSEITEEPKTTQNAAELIRQAKTKKEKVGV
ncbi:Uncharacterised protein [Yersinia frederiksenii]|nr:Uncharacterised protein [Yersinia frederiksenii]